MKAVRAHELGTHEVLRLEDIPVPEPGPGQVRVAVRACGVNFADSLLLAGRYQTKPPLPFGPGLEIAGDIDALGPGVEGIEVGDRVIGMPGHGGFAEYVLVPVATCVPMSAKMDYETAAAFPVAYSTSHVGLDHKAHLAAGEVLLVHGAAGGVGLTAVEIGKAMGATVVATASSRAKLEIAASKGADHLIDYAKEDIRERVKALTDGRGADVVYDPVGGEAFDASLRAINFEGRILVIGFASGDVPQIPANILLVKNVDVLGLNVGAYHTRRPEVIARSFKTLMAWFDEGRIAPVVSEVLPLEKAADAIALLTARKAVGKVVVRVGE